MKTKNPFTPLWKIQIACAYKVVIMAMAIMILLCGISITAGAQDILKLKSGREIKVTITEESSDAVKYREYENPSGPVYTITMDKIESIKYKKGSRESQETTPKEANKDIVATQDPLTMNPGYPQLTVKKRFVYLNDVKQNSRKVKTIMEDNPEAIRMYESGKRMCDMSNACAFGVIITSFVASTAANKQEDDADRKRISAIGLSIDGAFIITAIILSSSGKKNIRKSVSLYNSSAGKPVSYRMNVGLQDNGLGVGISF